MLHYSPPKGASEDIYIRSRDGQWQKVQTLKQGSYLVFHSTVPVTFAAVSSFHGILIAAVSITAAAALMGYVLVRRKKRMKPAACSDQTQL